MPRILLHIGAHKTATSYMQKKLALNVDLLARHGIHYDPLEIFRKNFTPLLNDEKTRATISSAKPWQRQRPPRSLFPKKTSWVSRAISCATAIITPARGCGWPAPATCWRPQRRNSSCRCASIPPSWSPCMASTSRHREFLDFADYLKIYQASGFGWMKVIDDIFAVVPGAKLHLWDFSSFRTVESDVFRTMLGFDPARLEEPEGPGARIPFRDCHHRHRDVEQGAQPRGNEKLIKPIARNLPKGEGRAGFDPLPPETKDVLRAQYKVDLSAILAKYPAINFIGG